MTRGHSLSLTGITVLRCRRNLIQSNLDYPDSLGLHKIVRIIEGPDNRGPDNRGSTVILREGRVFLYAVLKISYVTKAQYTDNDEE